MENQEFKPANKAKNIASIYPLSPMQQGMLFHSLYAPDSGMYFQQNSWNIRGDLNIEALKAAWQEVVDRHGVLRTFFVWKNRPTPLQVVLKKVTLPWKDLDWRDLSPEEQQHSLEELLSKQRRTEFLLSKAPLMEYVSIQLGDDNYQFIWNFHHILLDGWSSPVIFREVLSVYERELQNKTLRLPETLPYGDYIAWLEDRDREIALKFWQSMLQGKNAPTPLFVDRPVIGDRQSDCQELELSLSAKVYEGLKSVSQQNRVTLSTIAQAAWAVLLSSYSSEIDVLFGVTVSGRGSNLPGVENMVGLLINTLPLRLKIPSNDGLISWLKQIQQSMLELQQYSYSSLVNIQSASEFPGGTSLFESIVVFENYPVDSDVLSDRSSLQVTQTHHREQTNYPLTIEIAPRGELSIKIIYDRTLFTPEAIARMLDHLQNIFTAMAENPQQTVAELPLLGKAERYQLVTEWNNTEREYPQTKCIHQLFEDRVAKTPDAIAVLCDLQQLTYRQLNQKANRLACYLSNLGVKSETPVGIYVERSEKMLIGLLGILKAGGVYVPLDPIYPPERLSYMLQDSAVLILLTQESLLPSLPQHRAKVICLDSDWQSIERESTANLEVEVNKNNLAYIIYTSGSTGTPKGVTMSHAPLVNLITWQLKQSTASCGTKTGQLTSIGFDVSFQEIFATLCSGGILVPIPNNVKQDGIELLKFLNQQNIERLFLPFVALEQLAQSIFTNNAINTSLIPSSLRELITAGEQLQITPALREFLTHLPNCTLENQYGPTETHVVTVFRLDSQPHNWSLLPPIGKPIANTKIYILDKQLRPVPIGVPGEIYIGGECLAGGYLNREEFTKQKFIANPFFEGKRQKVESRSDNYTPAPQFPSSLLYKTEDLARYLPDGNIEYLGRVDRQVKIRGFRIELGEIESVLVTHPQVKQAVVVLSQTSQSKSLVAYIVTEKGSITSNSLRQYLLSKLPEYSIPAIFVSLESLPLTPNGKVDRKALPIHDHSLERQDEYVAPRIPQEEIIANIFARVLDLNNVSIYDNFFELGGHSLLATQVISRLRGAFKLEIPLREIFAFPTVAKLEPRLNELRNQGEEGILPPILPREVATKQLPLSWAQERLWFLDCLEGKNAVYNISGAIALSGVLDVSALELALSEIVRRHEVLRTSFGSGNGREIQQIGDRSITLEIIDLQQNSEAEKATKLQQIVDRAGNTPFDLEVDPLIRFTLLQLEGKKYVFLTTAHHIVADGWSIGVLLKELSSLYRAFVRGEPSPLEELPIQYVDFALWQREWLIGARLETQLNYWQQQLAGSPELLKLPSDRPRPAVQRYRGASRKFKIGEELTRQLKSLSQKSDVTLFMTLQAAFATLLYRYSGETDIVIGSPIANRNYRAIEPLIGFFVNTLLLRTCLEDNPSFTELLQQVRETILQAYEYQDVPFEKIIEALQPERSLSHSPLFQVMFILQNSPVEKLELPGINITPIDRAKNSTKFDLTLSLRESERGLVSSWQYNTDLFDGTTIDRLANHFQNLLIEIVKNPQKTVGDLPLLGKIERHQLLEQWNENQRQYSKDKCIHQLFEVQVEKTPNAIAVVFEGQQLTYSQLNQQANQLAHYLRTLGVQTETLVGICVERSLEMAISLLAILKAGGVYVPLDPTYPQERISYMLQDSAVSVLLTQDSLRSFLPQHSAEVVCLDADWQVIAAKPTHNLQVEVTAKNLIYVIYTSGSTGMPKGVMNIHQGVLNHLHWMQETFVIDSCDRILQKTPISFDVSTWEFFLPLISGARLVIAQPEGHKDPSYLIDIIEREQITTIHFVCSMLQVFLQEPHSNLSRCNSLKRTFCGGEPLSWELMQRFSTLMECELYHFYGPTETTINMTFCKCPPDLEITTVPIGRPIANVQIYILDEHLQPVPIGVGGDLYIGGDGLARGYLNRPQLTAEKFIPNPFVGENSHSPKLYKTGDLARYLNDGNIEFLGRVDNQVKIRGFRIELGEVEQVLSSHPQVDQGIVIAREDRNQNKLLVAYVTTKESTSKSELREYLSSRLPEYMIPAEVVSLDEIPLTPNGKVDRKVISAMEVEISSEAEYVAPRNEKEELIAQIWSDILGVEQVGVRDNFFELGGHSLLATQVISRLKQAFKLDIPLKALFEFPTVSALEQNISQLLNSADNLKLNFSLRELFTLDPEKKHQPFPLTDIQQAYWLGRQKNFELGNIATHSYFEIDFVNIDLPALNRALEKLIAHHDMLRAIILPSGKQQILAEVPPYEIEVSDLSRHSPVEMEKKLERIRQAMSHEILSPEQYPLFKIKASLLDNGKTRLHYSSDALISDAWSRRLLAQQLQELYTNRDRDLTRLEISFADYIRAELALRETEKYQKAKEYWFERDFPPAPELPFTSHLSEIAQPKFKRHSYQLQVETWQTLKQRASKVNITPSALLLTAFADVLNYWSKSPHFTINLTLFKRLPFHSQVNQLVGDFTSLTLLEVNQSNLCSFTQRGKRLQWQLWQDLEHNYVSGVEVQRELRRRRGKIQPMGVVFTSTLGFNSLSKNTSSSEPLGELTGEVVYSISQTSQVWLDHAVSETEEGALRFNWDVVEQLFPTGLMEDMFAAYCDWLQKLADIDSAWDKSSPQLLPPTQKALLGKVNQTTTAISSQTLPDLFRKQVAVNPNGTAVIACDKTLTYQELAKQANNLASQLRSRGAVPNTLVAVVMDKGWQQVVAVLGILISGAAYLPISPELPIERQQYLLEGGEVNLVVTQEQYRANLRNLADVECLLIDQKELTAKELAPLKLLQTPEDLAYVIYTSGSTGNPKGVAIKHQGVVNTILDVNRRFDVTSSDRILALSALEFDLSVYDIFGLLAAGGSIVMPAAEPCLRKDPALWLELINNHQVTIWNTVPALMQMLVEHLSESQKQIEKDLRLVLLSGDWLPSDLPKAIKSLRSDIEVISLGGATEASIWSIIYPITQVEPNCPSIPYGRPMNNQRFYVLDSAMQPTPLWVTGKLYIGGIGLAKEYWQDAEKTAKSFTIHPVTGDRLYETGDLGRYLPSGDIEFLGREDFQVKINGYRIELGEIEETLKQHELVKAAVVNYLDNKLIAYVVLNQDVGEQNFLKSSEKVEFKLKQLGLRQSVADGVEIALLSPEIDQARQKSYLRRQSYRQFTEQPIAIEEMSQLLGCLQQIQLEDLPLPKYRYPSAGDLYPVQTYITVKPDGINGLASGIYYYNPAKHSLIAINSNPEINGAIYGVNNQAIFEGSAFSIFLIAKPSAIAPIYGELARDFCLLEAGHIGQLLMHNAPDFELGLCPIGNVKFDCIQDYFALEEEQFLLYSFLGGKIAKSQRERVVPYQPKQGRNSVTDQMTEYLKQKLPVYLIPKECIVLDSLPLTVNGKVDRKSLPLPRSYTSRLSDGYVAPRNALEKQLALIWSEVLDVDFVGIYDNFFELGGDSVSATRVITQIREAFQVEFPLRDFFETPQIKNIGEYLAVVERALQAKQDLNENSERIEI